VKEFSPFGPWRFIDSDDVTYAKKGNCFMHYGFSIFPPSTLALCKCFHAAECAIVKFVFSGLYKWRFRFGRERSDRDVCPVIVYGSLLLAFDVKWKVCKERKV